MTAVKRSAVPTVVLLAALALVALLVYGVATSNKGGSRTLDDQVNAGKYPVAPGAGKMLPVLGQDTAKQSLGQFRGHVVVLNFWASWCGPCAAEAPLLKRAQESLKAKGGTVLGATFQDAPTDSIAKLRQWGLNYPNVRDASSRFAHSYGTTQLPETFVINAQGRVVGISRGQIDERFLDRAIARAGA